MLIDKHIGFDEKDGQGIDGSLFLNELLLLDTLGKKRIQVWICSEGGVVMDGYKIYNGILKTKKEPTILDIGCGTGLLSKAFLELGYTLYALDLSQDMLDLYKNPGKGRLIKICAEIEKFFEENPCEL